MSTRASTLSTTPVTGSVLYADLTCPACYLASLRTDLLAAAGLDTPQWRLVEHRPSIWLTPVTPDERTQAGRERELAAVLATVRSGEPIAPEALPRRVPGRLPNTGPAVTAYAEAVNAGVGDVVRRLLFAAYWLDGLDIGSSGVLRALLLAPVQHAVAERFDYARQAPWPHAAWTGAAEVVPWTGNVISVQGGAITAAGEDLVRSWRQERAALQAPACLTLLTATGELASGAAALDPLLLPEELLSADGGDRPDAAQPPLAAAG
jgi:hypothetical protein